MMFDIMFISYQESNADHNWQMLKQRFGFAQRVHGVKGIHEAHKQAANRSITKMFWVVDADAVIEPDFDFKFVPKLYHLQAVHVWRSRNPVNNLEYGYGGVKLLPKRKTMQMNMDSTDMTSSISDWFIPMPQISNVTAFNTDAFSAWKSAFRECVKLSSKIIDRQINVETEKRLHIWCNEGKEKPFGRQTIQGAVLGRQYGEQHRGNPTALKKINDFAWLQAQFESSTHD